MPEVATGSSGAGEPGGGGAVPLLPQAGTRVPGTTSVAFGRSHHEVEVRAVRLAETQVPLAHAPGKGDLGDAAPLVRGQVGVTSFAALCTARQA